MNEKNGFYLALLLLANPMMVLFFQNCSVFPQAKASKDEIKAVQQQSRTSSDGIVRYNFTKSI